MHLQVLWRPRAWVRPELLGAGLDPASAPPFASAPHHPGGALAQAVHREIGAHLIVADGHGEAAEVGADHGDGLFPVGAGEAEGVALAGVGSEVRRLAWK